MKEVVMIKSAHCLCPGQLFTYKGEYYMVATLHADRWMLSENRIYINLNNGNITKFTYEDVEIVHNLLLGSEE